MYVCMYVSVADLRTISERGQPESGPGFPWEKCCAAFYGFSTSVSISTFISVSRSTASSTAIVKSMDLYTDIQLTTMHAATYFIIIQNMADKMAVRSEGLKMIYFCIRTHRSCSYQ